MQIFGLLTPLFGMTGMLPCYGNSERTLTIMQNYNKIGLSELEQSVYKTVIKADGEDQEHILNEWKRWKSSSSSYR